MVIQAKKNFLKSHARPFLAALAVIIIFFIPLLFKYKPLLFDDAAYEFLPRQIALARSIQNLEIPLWDHNRFLGGCPFYSDNETGTYSWLLYPFWALADTNDLDNSYFFLYLLPFVFFVFISWLNFYILLVKNAACSRLGAFMGAIFWALGPHMLTDAFLYTSDLLVFAFFPLALHGLADFIKEPGWLNFFKASFYQTLMVSGGDLNYILRCYVFIFIFIFVKLIFLKGPCFYRNRSFYKLLFISLAGVGFCSALMILPFWAGVSEGAWWMFGHDADSLKLTKNYEYSIGFSYLINIIFPDFFGIPKGTHIQGAGWFQFHEFGMSGILTGSFALFFLCVLFIIKNRGPGRPDAGPDSGTAAHPDSRPDSLKEWFYSGLVFQGATLFLILNVYTPFYNFAKSIVPFVFSLPFPVYYRFGQCLGAALCCGTGVTFFMDYLKTLTAGAGPAIIDGQTGESAIIDGQTAEPLIIGGFKKIFTAFIVISFLAALIGLSLKSHFYDNLKFYDKSLLRTDLFVFVHDYLSGDQAFADFSLTHFLTNIFLPLLFIIFTALFIKFPGRLQRFFKRAFLFFLLAGFIITSGEIFYLNPDTLPDYKDQELTNFDKVYKKRSFGPKDHSLYQPAAQLNKIKKPEQGRFLSISSFSDNYSWIFNKMAVFGNDSKPVYPAVYQLLSTFASGFPYQLSLNKINFTLFSNLGVTSFISQKGVIESSGIMRLDPESAEEIVKNDMVDYSDMEYSIKQGPLSEFHLDYRPLGFFSLTDNYFIKPLQDQLGLLSTMDLKKGVLIDRPGENDVTGEIGVPDAQGVSGVPGVIGVIKDYKISANSCNISLHLDRPGFLVVNQCWHSGWQALVNNAKRPVLRANWYMQAIYLDKGTNEVRLDFFPPLLRYAFKISIILFIICFSFIYKRKYKELMIKENINS